MADLDQYDPLFEAAGREWNVDPTILKAIAHQESGGNPKAVSKKGARGVMQIMPGTGAELGMTDLHDPVQSIFGGAKYLSQLLDKFNDSGLALAAYNAGPNRVDDYRSGRQSLPRETMAYVPSVAALYQQFARATPPQAATPAAFNTDNLSDLEREAIGLPPREGAKPKLPPAAITPQDDLEREATGTTAVPGKGQIDPVTGQPFQFAEAAKGPVAEALGKPISEGNKPGLVAQAAINLPIDPEARRRIAAAQLFPGQTPLEAQSRVFYGDDNRLAAVDQNGNPFYVDPQAPSISQRTIGNPLLWMATGAGPAMSAAGGLVGGMAGGPASLVAGPVGAAVGAAGGDMARQYLASRLDPNRPQIDLSQTAREAALSGVGQLGGALAGRALAPNPLRVGPGEVSIMRVPSVMADTQDAYARAAQQGVDMTPGQATGLRSLLQYEDAAANMPGTVDAATDFYRRQGNQLAAAGQNMLERISPNADKTDAALMFSQGAADATRIARQAANAAARPSYEAAQQAGNVMSPDLAQLAEVPVVQAAMKKAGATYKNLYRTAAPETPDFALWDLTKRQLDDAFTVAQRAGERTDAMAIDKARADLLTHLDAAYPSYAQARSIAAPGQRLASQLEATGVGSAADAAGAERAKAIVAPVFNQNPRAITQARDAFAAAGKSDEWYAGVRAYIQDAFDKASMSQQGFNPSMLRRQVWGNVDNRDAIKAALTPKQYEGFDNFLKTVEDVSRTYPINSLTSMRLNARGALVGAAENEGNVKTLDTLAAATSPGAYLNLGRGALGGLRQWMVGRNLQRIVGHLFNPDGLQYLESMAAYSPGSMRAITATAQLASRAAPNLLAAPEGAAPNPMLALPAR